MGDFGKYRYDLQQKAKDAKKKQKAVTWKEIRVSPKIDDHDIDTKIRSAAKFLDEGDKLKVTVGFDAGFHAEAGVSYAGPFAGARGKLAAAIVRARLKETHGIKSPHRIDVIGLSSLFATAGATQDDSRDVRLHVALRTVNREEAETMLWEVESLLCCGPAGGGGFRGAIMPAVMTKSVLINRSLVNSTVEMFVA